ncbi:MAG: hypothetical protein WCF88_22270 [Candidatus Acidiferrales bacterium]
MDTCRLRVKIGPYEMEAEGPRDFVEKHYGSFSERIPVNTQLATMPESPSAVGPTGLASLEDSPYTAIFRAEGKFVTLTARPSGKDAELEGMLLILLGNKELSGTDLVSADGLLYGLKQSGFAIDRTDRLAARAEEQGLITKTGIRRGTRYRLTNPGTERAKAIAGGLMLNLA